MRSVVVGLFTVLLVAVAAPAAEAAGRCGTHPWCSTALSPDDRAGRLLQALTPAERVSLLGGDDLLGVLGGAGHHTGTSDGVPRVDLPTLYMSDGPAGSRQGSATAMPAPIALGASFDRATATRYGALVGDEVRKKGNDLVFAPTLDIMRTPLGGRTFESYGEDPFLTGTLGTSWVQGAQRAGVIATVKHVAANNQEGKLAEGTTADDALIRPIAAGSRFTVNANVDARTLREIYLAPYEAAITGGHAGAAMCSYNRLGGSFACQNDALLNGILRKDWGFQGAVIADYGAVHDTAAALNGGLDIEPWPGTLLGSAAVNEALAAGTVTQATVDRSVRRTLRMMFASGMFDRAAYREDDTQIDQAGHARQARTVAESGTVLLENRGLLPLATKGLKSVALIGVGADTFRGGGGSSKVVPFRTVTLRQALTARLGAGVDVRYDPGNDPAVAAALAKDADVAIVVGVDSSSEGGDRRCLRLSCTDGLTQQDAMIDAVAAANRRTVVVLQTSGPVLTPWRDRVQALLEAWYPGESGGEAVTRVLLGDAEPGGRLPATFPKREEDEATAGDPEAYPGVDDQVRYKEGVLVGYRWFDAKRITPAYPFGAGLSYTTWRYRDLRIHRSRGRAPATVSVTVTNTGRRRGSDVAQLYLRIPAPRAGQVAAPRQLKGFRRVALKPGHSARITFTLTPRDLASWNTGANAFRVKAGCYPVMLGRSSRDIVLKGRLPVAGGRCR